ncbi:hypothetical protein D3C75_1086420 [compost metagenome]
MLPLRIFSKVSSTGTPPACTMASTPSVNGSTSLKLARSQRTSCSWGAAWPMSAMSVRRSSSAKAARCLRSTLPRRPAAPVISRRLKGLLMCYLDCLVGSGQRRERVAQLPQGLFQFLP